MPRTCTICRHKRHEQINAALIAGEPFRDIARQYRTTKDALTRHKEEHLIETLTKAREARDLTNAENLLTQLNDLAEDARRIKLKCEQSNDYRTALMGIRELVRIVELLAEMQGKLSRAAQVSILLAPEWLTLRLAILRALDSYPDAKAAVIQEIATNEQPKSLT